MPTDTEPKPLDGALALVTGASRGIGRAAALALSNAGAHVILLARATGALEEVDDEIRAAGGVASLVAADLTDMDGIDRLGAAIAERWGKLDVLVLNAGVLGELAPLGHIAPKVWTQTFAINVEANWRLLRAFDPLLKASEAARVIAVTSSVADGLRPYWGAYAASKAALDAMVRTYAAECENFSVNANLLDPGRMATSMRAKAMPGEDQGDLPDPDELAPLFVELARPDRDLNGALVSFKKWKAEGSATPLKA